MSSNWNKKDEPTANDNTTRSWIADKANKTKSCIKSGIEKAEETIQSGRDSVSHGIENVKNEISSRIHSDDGKPTPGEIVDKVKDETNVDFPRSIPPSNDYGVNSDRGKPKL